MIIRIYDIWGWGDHTVGRALTLHTAPRFNPEHHISLNLTGEISEHKSRRKSRNQFDVTQTLKEVFF